MSYSDLLKPRRDVLSEDGIEGIIDFENLKDPRKRKIEARPADFFALTYPTADARRVIETVHRRFSGDRDAPGLFLFEGLKGSGKSHLLVMVYHLFKNRPAGQDWLGRHNLKCDVPQDAVVVINKLTDLPLHSIWDFIFEALTGKPPQRTGLQPGLDEMKAALGDRFLILVLDELERGIQGISNPAIQTQNVAFLQMLSEWSSRENRVTLFASIYSDQVEPGSTLKRVPSCRIRFEHASDKDRVVLHRLFENYLDLKPEACRPVIDSYLSAWRRHGAVQTDDFTERFSESFPFSPDVLEVILDRVPARGGFQNLRGALGFLTRLVKLTHQRADMITPAHADLSDQVVTVLLSDLDPAGDLIRRARDNMKELESYPLVNGLGATAMLYTLSGSGRDRGATREHLLRAVSTPATDINEFERALLALQRYGSYFHVQEGRYFFDRDEQPNAKVELRSLLVPEERARDLIRRLWGEDLFREPVSAVVLTDVEKTKEALGEMEKGRLRFVLSPRRLNAEERHLLYHGLDERNQVILLEPRDPQFDALANRDLLKWAQRALAAEDLKPTAQDASRKEEYDRIGRDDRKNISDALKRAGLVYVRVEKYGNNPSEDVFEEENLGNSITKENVIEKLGQLFPVQYLAEHLMPRLSELRGVSVKDVNHDYRNILGFPVPTHQNSVSRAIRVLCRERHLGVRHQSGNFCGQEPALTDTELSNATLDAPFERPRPDQPPTPGPRPEPPQPTPGAQPPGPVPPPVPPRTEYSEIVIPSQRGPGALRQQLASRLQQIDGVRISRVRFTIFLESASGDLSALPQALRGNLSGAGSLMAEVTITKEEVGGKGDVEQIAERLPNFPGASYGARLDIVVPASVENEG
ncbi:MAG: hypothetical protein A3F84_28950 [Candidatus Handelsmanbacteria bacterium RIFCSPLOWO2_12_FULL_64_10]|uniref:Uncharacterized protein n=1 Tax=Handelsmanbacteria sp. (strain RIFCSPLOWO2_12_FULL_64_10) TaxID=1817868 RepID=A0A1F6CT95_HANXR|nr:MAG: hypothetical protein A3F84_28950 [Candidatus Handelsmanbacteria bacterium RIFCSPLOWO2_12_FULL_64_10]